MSLVKPIFIILAGLTALCFIIYSFFSFQRRMIYHPRQYDNTYSKDLAKVLPIVYETEQGSQTAFYYEGQAMQPPNNLWILFCGNASLALDWFDRLLDHYSDHSSSFFLLDYPGYGECEGKASPNSIRKSADIAIETLFKRYKAIHFSKKTQINVIGHSLGAAIALDFASRHSCKKIILLAPFTSLYDMAKRVVGVPFCYALTHHLDNHLRLSIISEQKTVPKVYLFHGSNDTVIPVTMGKQLAESFPSFIHFIELPLTDHQTIFVRGRYQIFKAMENHRAPI
jgi:pimeloyl-ACP methyl ester carboxylesterase